MLLAALAALVYVVRIEREMADFDVYRVAAERALAAQPLYRMTDVLPFKYLPAFALAMAPFAKIDHEAAKAIWFALSAGLLTAFVRWSVRALPERRRSDRTLVWLVVLFMAKFYAHDLELGQTNIELGVLLVGALLALQIDQPKLGGAILGLAVFVKPYAVILLPWLAFTYGLVPTLVALAVCAVGLVAPAAVYGWAGNLTLLHDWFRLTTDATAGGLLGADNVSLAAMWAKWVGIGPQATGLATVTTGALLGLVATVWMWRTRVDSPEYLEVALLMLLVPLLSPHGWDYVLLLGTPAVVCLLDRWKDVDREWRAVVAVALGLMGLTLFDVMGRALYARFMATSIVSVAAITVAVALAHLRWKALG